VIEAAPQLIRRLRNSGTKIRMLEDFLRNVKSITPKSHWIHIGLKADSVNDIPGSSVKLPFVIIQERNAVFAN
jgi:hypothetical protein